MGEWWKVRLVFDADVSALFIASATEPVVSVDMDTGALVGLEYTPLGAVYGCSVLGYVDWSAISSISWETR